MIKTPEEQPWTISKDFDDKDDIVWVIEDDKCGNICTFPSGYAEDKELPKLLVASREMLRVLKEIARLPVASMYPDGPCLERSDMEDVLAVIKLAETP